MTLPSPVSVWVVSAEPSVPRKITFLGPFRLCDDRGRPQLLINRWADGVGGRACQMPVTQRAGLQGIPRPASWSALDPSTGELVCRGAPLAAGRCQVAAASAAGAPAEIVRWSGTGARAQVITVAGPFVMLNDVIRPQVLIIRGTGGLPLRAGGNHADPAVPAASAPGALGWPGWLPRDQRRRDQRRETGVHG